MESTSIDQDLPKTVSHEELFKKKIWRVDDVMTFTGIGYSTLMRFTCKNRIPHRKRANKLYFIPEEIMNWIDEGER